MVSDREPSEARPSEFLLDLLEFAGLLNFMQRTDGRVDEESQDQHAGLIHSQRAISAAIPFGTDLMQVVP